MKILCLVLLAGTRAWAGESALGELNLIAGHQVQAPAPPVEAERKDDPKSLDMSRARRLFNGGLLPDPRKMAGKVYRLSARASLEPYGKSELVPELQFEYDPTIYLVYRSADGKQANESIPLSRIKDKEALAWRWWGVLPDGSNSGVGVEYKFRCKALDRAYQKLLCQVRRSYFQAGEFAAGDVFYELYVQVAKDVTPRTRAQPRALKPMDAFNKKIAGIAAKFIPIKPGQFQMGSPAGEQDRGADEAQHTVEISKAFEMQATEVTQFQYLLVTGNNPSSFQTVQDCAGARRQVVNGVELFCPHHPVESVSWDETQEFIKRLNQMQSRYAYRLPTEAEWEYAARAGSLSAYSFGDAGGLDQYAWFNDNSGGRTHAAAVKKANPWGLYDMHGNVWEWVQDWYGPYPGETVTNPAGPSTGSSRVLRGGSWFSDAGGLRSAVRYSGVPGGRYGGVGFRLVRSSR
ncbi:MAG: formylglycine-generating enzyme family protein [Elusimicrobia bacterium]|nr:formylglycine-generating enzyme family protein [Elusimicrobiota bacterium]